jgi:tripartite-type tricarboxylate transporter receptor subunit TctC
MSRQISPAIACLEKMRCRLIAFGGPEIPIIATGSTGVIGWRETTSFHISCPRAIIRILSRCNMVKLPRRTFLHLAAGAAALPAILRVARAQTYPARPVRVIVPFAPGGLSDILARLMGQWLSERLGQSFIIENRPGAGTNIGTEVVVRAPPDGNTLLLASTANSINATLYEKLNFNFLRDFAPVAGLMRVPNVMEVNPSVAAKTVPEFIAYAKANPGRINMGSGGIGASPHMSGELFMAMAGVNMIHVRPGGDS